MDFLLNLSSSSLLCSSSVIYSLLSYLIDLEKIKEEVVAKEAKITKLEEEIVAKEARITKFEEEGQTKDQSIAYTTTRLKEVTETFEKEIKGN